MSPYPNASDLTGDLFRHGSTAISERPIESKQVSVPGADQYTREVSVVTIKPGTPAGSGPWKTSRHSVAELRREGSKIIAVHYDIDEYGIGETSEEALADLLTSLAEYRASLEKRKGELAPKELNELQRLNELLQS